MNAVLMRVYVYVIACALWTWTNSVRAYVGLMACAHAPVQAVQAESIT